MPRRVFKAQFWSAVAVNLMHFSKKPNEKPASEHVMSEGSILGTQKSKQWLGFGTGAKW